MQPPDNLLRSIACSVDEIDSTAPSTTELDVVTALDALARVIIEHNRRLLTGEQVNWKALADLLGEAERACQQMRPPEPGQPRLTVPASDGN